MAETINNANLAPPLNPQQAFINALVNQKNQLGNELAITQGHLAIAVQEIANQKAAMEALAARVAEYEKADELTDDPDVAEFEGIDDEDGEAADKVN